MTFTELLALVSSPNSGIRVCSDSRSVGAGDVFVAVAGIEVDGHDYIGEASAKGAGFVVCEKPRDCTPAEAIAVQSSSEALGVLAQASFGNPSSKLTNLAVTGTNGKTTVSYLVRSVIQTAGEKCGMIGTIEYDTGAEKVNAKLTTPDAVDIARMSSEIVEQGGKFMVIEASSHALSQNRLAGINFTAAAFTNLTGDHLDYHKSRENYLDAKTELFRGLPSHAIAVLNTQSMACEAIAEETRVRTLWYAVDDQADISAYIEKVDIDGTVFRLEFGGERQVVKSDLAGFYNVSNHLAATGLCLAAGFSLNTIAKGLSALKCVPGRLEKIDHEGDFTVLVDYAHTDDALGNVLKMLSELCEGKLIVVFGCGGDRDRSKRPRMAAVAQDYADSIFVTSDNPRSESAEKIIEEIMTGFEQEELDIVTVEPDRRKAIELAIAAAGKDDIVLIAGKGHEDYQIIGSVKHYFDDREVVRELLNK